MGLVAGCQPLLQGEALALLCQNLCGVGIGLIGTLGLVGGFFGGQLLAVGVGLPLPRGPRAASHQCKNDQQHPTPLHRVELHANTLSARAYRACRTAAPFWPPLICWVVLSNWPVSASVLSPLDAQYQAADIHACWGFSSSSGCLIRSRPNPSPQGEVLGEVKGGMYFVDLQAAIMGSSDPLLAQMLELG